MADTHGAGSAPIGLGSNRPQLAAAKRRVAAQVTSGNPISSGFDNRYVR